VFANTHVGILSINDSIAHVYFHFVSAGRDIESLWMVVGWRRLSGLYTIYKDERTDRGAGHDELARVRRPRLTGTEPTAGGQAGQHNE